MLPTVDAQGILFSIDFEDFSHDLKRDLGLWQTGPIRSEALWRAYADIETFLKRLVGRPRITFFCTGIVAEQAPDLVARIAADGHEIACHYHFHDEMDRQSPEEVEVNIGAAKAALEAASGVPVRGFRAPKFRIEKHDPAQYMVVERHFDYDSSWFGGSIGDLAAFRARMGLTRLRILPIFEDRVVPGGPKLKLGGSYFKLFPGLVSRRLIAGAFAAGIQPHIYLHPYEFCRTGDFLLSRARTCAAGREGRGLLEAEAAPVVDGGQRECGGQARGDLRVPAGHGSSGRSAAFYGCRWSLTDGRSGVGRLKPARRGVCGSTF